jgi:hypothetical protein
MPPHSFHDLSNTAQKGYTESLYPLLGDLSARAEDLHNTLCA